MSIPAPSYRKQSPTHPTPRHQLTTAAVVAVLTITTSCTANPQPTATRGPELDTTTMPPWPAPTNVADRVKAAGLDLGPMGTAEHYHPTLQILIRGQQAPIAANIGVDQATGTMSALHTHEPDGTIHIEADTVGQKFTLGQLFTQWGVKLTTQQIGGAHAAPGRTVVVSSNGRTVPGDPANLRLQPDQQIVVQVP